MNPPSPEHSNNPSLMRHDTPPLDMSLMQEINPSASTRDGSESLNELIASTLPDSTSPRASQFNPLQQLLRYGSHSESEHSEEDTHNSVPPQFQTAPTARLDRTSQTTYSDWNCAGCGFAELGRIDEETDAAAMFCDRCEKWSHADCIDVQFGLPENWADPHAAWTCPLCRTMPLWNDSLYVSV